MGHHIPYRLVTECSNNFISSKGYRVLVSSFHLRSLHNSSSKGIRQSVFGCDRQETAPSHQLIRGDSLVSLRLRSTGDCPYTTAHQRGFVSQSSVSINRSPYRLFQLFFPKKKRRYNYVGFFLIIFSLHISASPLRSR